MAVQEGAWNCTQCNTKGIPGGTPNCTLCGDPRNPSLDPEERPYLPENARVVTDATELDRANSGPNWNCGHCGHANRATDHVCNNCLEPLNHDDTVAGVHTYVSGVAAEGVTLDKPGQLDEDHIDAVLAGADKLQQLADGPIVMPNRTFGMDALRRNDKSREQQDFYEASSPVSLVTSRFNPRRLIQVGIVAAVVFAVIMGGWLTYTQFIRAEPVDLTVVGLSWDRQIEIEEYRTLTMTDWTVPADGRIITQQREIRSYKEVLDHYETKTREVPRQVKTGTTTEKYECGSTTVDMGNGYFDEKEIECTRTVDVYTTVYDEESYKDPVYRNEPVYGTKYTYQVDRWVTDHFVREKGLTNPVWPEPDPKGDKQRVGDERRQTYTVVLTDPEGERHTRTTSLKSWKLLDEGEVVRAKQTRSGIIRGVSWPR